MLQEANFLRRRPRSKRPPNRPPLPSWEEEQAIYRDLRASVTEDEIEEWKKACSLILLGVPDWEQERAIRYLTSHVSPKTLNTFYQYIQEGAPTDVALLEDIRAIVYYHLEEGKFEWDPDTLSSLWLPLMSQAIVNYKTLTQSGKWKVFIEQAHREFSHPLVVRLWRKIIGNLPFMHSKQRT